ncbi:MAG: adenylate/guanylate cyclase domain-containing protein [Chloroflexi bacterium]|nr:adenylate/guanylate cyclase domain-containing protein [Chloroflexota bacterium]MDK1045372.1 adenylate/guanylate cyclase domain-containing protein [Anaerolineales bacterium]MCI0772553.1 adenylate/guanylate cyclase domain-containing protein [Chloroflexota bacterium]MCI0807279.1 adenylate/guanylate cyclase domain-containing protein [Chloroflexota bacterium]MCI0827715.1 adenylate/guanylate cyclase domain-containing protein [Chloroflexota bacterium]
MDEKMDHDARIEEGWRSFLEKGEFKSQIRQRRIFRHLPSEPRCKFCNAPFHGPGGLLVRVLFDKGPSRFNPRLCNACEHYAAENLGGAEIELSMLFADVRGSTTLAEQMGTTEFSRLISRFYEVATDVMVNSDALVDKLIGDEVTGLYTPGFAGPDHARVAIEAAKLLLTVTGHLEPEGPWVPVGAGVHTGEAFVGAVGSKQGLIDITALGDGPNTAARLAGAAAIGEIVISDDAAEAAELDADGLEQRSLDLKGKSEPVSVRVIKIQPASQ